MDLMYYLNHIHYSRQGAQPFDVSEPHTKKRVVLGHTSNTQTLMKTAEQKTKQNQVYDFMLDSTHNYLGLYAACWWWIGHPCYSITMQFNSGHK